MPKFLDFALGAFLVFGLASSADAINITLAEVQNGVAVVKGNKAAKNATIIWQNANVAKTNKGGAFSFSAAVPNDCIGTLSDGVSTIEVAVLDCTPVTGPTTLAWIVYLPAGGAVAIGKENLHSVWPVRGGQ